MRRLIIAVWLVLAGIAQAAAPAPYPVTINSRSGQAPDLQAHRASEWTLALSFTDGTNVSDITGYTVWASWSTNAQAATCSTAACVIVNGSNGTATATFAPAAMNYDPGTYVYEVGVSTGSTIRAYSQGVLTILGSPYASGVPAVSWSSNWVWSAFNRVGWPTTRAGYGITDAAPMFTNRVGTQVYTNEGIELYAGQGITFSVMGRQIFVTVTPTNTAATWGTLNGTNGYYYTSPYNGTNYWTLTP